MSNEYRLSARAIEKLQDAHRQTKIKRQADRIKAVILLGRGWTARNVAEALLIDEDTVRAYFKRYREGGLEKLVQMDYPGSGGWLDGHQLAELDEYLQDSLCLSAKEVVDYVAQRWDVHYSVRGMTELLHRLGYVYKKPKLVPGKADSAAQEAFLKAYQDLKKNKAEQDPIYFIDATHPHHNPVVGYGWIKRGLEHSIRSNTGRRRLNINGAIDVDGLQPVVRFDETINAASTVALFRQLEAANPQAEKIHVIADNARYYRSKEVSKYLQKSKIDLIFLPPYSPNLNLIERFWKFFKKQVLYNQYYESFNEFKAACEEFFQNSSQYTSQLRSLLTDNFQIIRV
ncbi:MAG: IS630 family transposase [Verrucomicrobiales bacterium]|nr:IS630 family transposase [Verrucomicrobiales bacterium]